MTIAMYEIKREMEEIFEKFMELSHPGHVKESDEEFKDRKIDCIEATARVIQGKLAGNK